MWAGPWELFVCLWSNLAPRDAPLSNAAADPSPPFWLSSSVPGGMLGAG